jgi:hypothetical protein
VKRKKYQPEGETAPAEPLAKVGQAVFYNRPKNGSACFLAATVASASVCEETGNTKVNLAVLKDDGTFFSATAVEFVPAGGDYPTCEFCTDEVRDEEPAPVE